MMDLKAMDTRTNRMVWLARNIDDGNGNFSKESTGVCVNIQISATLPVFTFKDDIITRTKKHEIVTPVDSRLDLVTNLPYDIDYEADPVNAGKARFMYITEFDSGVTKVKNIMLYDRKYKDILVVPDLDFLDNSDDIILQDTTFVISAFRIGSSAIGLNSASIDSFLSPDKNLIALPEPIENAGNKVTVNLINGIANDTKNKSTWVFEKYASGEGITRGDMIPASFINLGTVEELFGDAGTIVPFSIAYQITPETFNISYIGNKSPKQRDLYIMLKF